MHWNQFWEWFMLYPNLFFLHFYFGEKLISLAMVMQFNVFILRFKFLYLDSCDAFIIFFMALIIYIYIYIYFKKITLLVFSIKIITYKDISSLFYAQVFWGKQNAIL